ncbi:MAG TPA: methyltransferase [Candidatus Acidoferrum sp.]
MGKQQYSAQQSLHSDYMFANKGKEAPIRFAALAAIYDPQTIRHLETLGVACGWCCLEVGAGSGTIAKWLADRVAPTGHVLVTDVDTRFLEPLRGPALDVRPHDIGSDALPDAEFDLIHTRLVLMHVRQRDTALARMVSSLKAGGWLLVEEYDSCSVPPDPTLSSGEMLLQTHVAMLRLLEDGGVNRRYGRLLSGLLRESGLTSVGASAQLFMWHSGSPGIAMMRANFEQLREAMIEAHYITPQQFDEDLERLNDPSFRMPSSMLWSAWGRRS